MASYKLGELKNQVKFQEKVMAEISAFIRLANKYVYGQQHLSLDYGKNMKTQQQLDFLLAEIQDYKEAMIKASRRMKPRSQAERDSFRGPNSAIIGNSRTMVKKLDTLSDRIRWLKQQVNVFVPTGPEAAHERTMTLVQETVSIEHGKLDMLPGQGIIIAIAMLCTIFVDIKARRSKSKNNDDE